MLIYIVIVLFTAYLGVGIILYIMQPKFLYHPVREVPYNPGELDLDFEELFFETSDGFRILPNSYRAQRIALNSSKLSAV